MSCDFDDYLTDDLVQHQEEAQAIAERRQVLIEETVRDCKRLRNEAIRQGVFDYLDLRISELKRPNERK